MHRSTLALLLLALVILGVAFHHYGRFLWFPMYSKIVGKHTVAQVIEHYGEQARARLQPHFDAAGVAYPPTRITLLALKEEARLELWAEGEGGAVWIRDLPIEGLSGGPGPKLREGDGQVPEGFYRVVGFNPNSAYHLSMKLNYPNAFDLRHAEAEGRDQPGSDIFIHGKNVSIGCLAMGDPAIEELFVLAHDVGRSSIEVAIAPRDPRETPLSSGSAPPWVGELYEQINDYFTRYGSPP